MFYNFDTILVVLEVRGTVLRAAWHDRATVLNAWFRKWSDQLTQRIPPDRIDGALAELTAVDGRTFTFIVETEVHPEGLEGMICAAYLLVERDLGPASGDHLFDLGTSRRYLHLS